MEGNWGPKVIPTVLNSYLEKVSHELLELPMENFQGNLQKLIILDPAMVFTWVGTISYYIIAYTQQFSLKPENEKFLRAFVIKRLCEEIPPFFITWVLDSFSKLGTAMKPNMVAEAMPFLQNATLEQAVSADATGELTVLEACAAGRDIL